MCSQRVTMSASVKHSTALEDTCKTEGEIAELPTVGTVSTMQDKNTDFNVQERPQLTEIDPVSDWLALQSATIVHDAVTAQEEPVSCEKPTNTVETSLHAALIAFVIECERNGIKQHSPEWEKVRLHVCGGSTVAIFTGDAYNGILSYVYEKLSLSTPYHFGTMPKVIYLNWGNIFEPLIEKVVAKELKCEIYGENMFIVGFQQDGKLYTAYSPDGLAVIQDQITLLEFKCPFSRLPLRGGIPKLYLPQVRMGLDLIPLAQRGIFVDAVFRRCALGALDTSCDFDTALNQPAPSEGGQLLPVKAIGVVFFGNDEYRRAQVLVSLKATRRTKHTDQIARVFNGVDFGTTTVDDFEAFMVQYQYKIIQPWYVDPYYTGDTVCVTLDVADKALQFAAYCSEKHLTNAGQLCWKLFQTQYSEVKRVPDFCAPLLPMIISTMDLLRAATDQPLQRKRELVDEWSAKYFPVKGIVRIDDCADFEPAPMTAEGFTKKKRKPSSGK